MARALVQDAQAVLAAAFVNRASVVEYVLAQRQCGLSDLVGKAAFARGYGVCRCDRPQRFETNNLPLGTGWK